MFIVRAYAKQELACLYFPTSDPRTAVNRLTLWVKRCQPLLHSLEAIGYNKYSKYYTAREVALIVAHLGDP